MSLTLFPAMTVLRKESQSGHGVPGGARFVPAIFMQ
jgi:hypothetical protein